MAMSENKLGDNNTTTELIQTDYTQATVGVENLFFDRDLQVLLRGSFTNDNGLEYDSGLTTTWFWEQASGNVSIDGVNEVSSYNDNHQHHQPLVIQPFDELKQEGGKIDDENNDLPLKNAEMLLDLDLNVTEKVSSSPKGNNIGQPDFVECCSARFPSHSHSDNGNFIESSSHDCSHSSVETHTNQCHVAVKKTGEDLITCIAQTTNQDKQYHSQSHNHQQLSEIKSACQGDTGYSNSITETSSADSFNNNPVSIVSNSHTSVGTNKCYTSVAVNTCHTSSIAKNTCYDTVVTNNYHTTVATNTNVCYSSVVTCYDVSVTNCVPTYSTSRCGYPTSSKHFNSYPVGHDRQAIRNKRPYPVVNTTATSQNYTITLPSSTLVAAEKSSHSVSGEQCYPSMHDKVYGSTSNTSMYGQQVGVYSLGSDSYLSASYNPHNTAVSYGDTTTENTSRGVNNCSRNISNIALLHENYQQTAAANDSLGGSDYVGGPTQQLANPTTVSNISVDHKDMLFINNGISNNKMDSTDWMPFTYLNPLTCGSGGDGSQTKYYPQQVECDLDRNNCESLTSFNPQSLNEQLDSGDSMRIKLETDNYVELGQTNSSENHGAGYMTNTYCGVNVGGSKELLCSVIGDTAPPTHGYYPLCGTRLGNMAAPSSIPTAAQDELSNQSQLFGTTDHSPEALDFDDGIGEEHHRGKRLHHSEIEKRRRDKMNSYIVELASLIPMCGDVNRKLDKLTVLRMAVQHIKSLKGSGDSLTEVSHLPTCISEEEVKELILKAAEGFSFSVSCDRGKILHVSASVSKILQYDQTELTGMSLFDFLHHKDVHKVKDQLATNEFVSKERYIDTKTMKLVKTKLPQTNSELRSGGRRLFVCRIKKNTNCDKSTTAMEDDGDENSSKTNQTPVDSDYLTMVCSGYIKAWSSKPGTAHTEEDDSNSENNSTSMNLNKLVAVALPVQISENLASRIPESELRCSQIEFMSRLNIEGKFTYADPRVTSVLGYLPQELIGTSIYEYCHPKYVDSFSEIHKRILMTNEKVKNRMYKFRTKDRKSVMLSTTAFVFRNPWTKDREHIVCNQKLVPSQECGVTSSSEDEMEKAMYMESKMAGLEGRVILPIAHQNPSNIGKKIAIQANRRSPRMPADSTINIGKSRVSKNLNYQHSQTDQTSSSCIDSSSGTETTDEASMAIIMNLLEADAGLGGPVDFSDLPWPL